jgi:hypothetical protein
MCTLESDLTNTMIARSDARYKLTSQTDRNCCEESPFRAATAAFRRPNTIERHGRRPRPAQ